MIENKRLLVFSAHAADFVWRAGGTIAKYIDGGADVHVVVLSMGVRGESNDLWKKEGQTAESVKAARMAESIKAAETLGVRNIEYWDLSDYPIVFDGATINQAILKIRTVRPDYVITHDKNDLFNPDHDEVAKTIYSCCVQANSAGVRTEGLKHTRQMNIFGFEPHQTEISGYVPGIMVDITAVYEKKVAAMNCFRAQSHLIEYYTQRAFLRGNHARRISGETKYKYAESFARYYPVVGEELI
jgi:4-oxalomesaconate hydratase